MGTYDPIWVLKNKVESQLRGLDDTEASRRKYEEVVAEFRYQCFTTMEQIRKEHSARIAVMKGQITRLSRKIEDIEAVLAAREAFLKSWHSINPDGLSGSFEWSVPAPAVAASPEGAGIPAVSGVYFVWLSQDIHSCQYVGQSVNLNQRTRVGQNGERHDGKIRYGEWVSWLPVEVNDLYHAEMFYIGLLRPPRNHHHTLRTASLARAQPGAQSTACTGVDERR